MLYTGLQCPRRRPSSPCLRCRPRHPTPPLGNHKPSGCGTHLRDGSSDFNFLERQTPSFIQELSKPAASSLLSGGDLYSVQQLLCVVEGVEVDGGEGRGPSLTRLMLSCRSSSAASFCRMGAGMSAGSRPPPRHGRSHHWHRAGSPSSWEGCTSRWMCQVRSCTARHCCHWRVTRRR